MGFGVFACKHCVFCHLLVYRICFGIVINGIFSALMRLSRNIVIKAIVAMVLVAAMAFYYFVNPEQSDFVPKCAFKHLTGYDCPSCGVQRAFHSALHGDFIKALSYNPFLLISLPYFLLVLYATISKNQTSKILNKITHHRYALYIYIILFFAWWIVRNIGF